LVNDTSNAATWRVLEDDNTIDDMISGTVIQVFQTAVNCLDILTLCVTVELGDIVSLCSAGKAAVHSVAIAGSLTAETNSTQRGYTL